MQTPKKYSHVIWDWNGTLFDDVAQCIRTINKMLSDRNMKILNGVSDYHNVFCFPVINYYEKVGFDFEKEPFEDLAKEYISLYHSENTGSCKLHNNAELVLKSIQGNGMKQVILSASELNCLLLQINEFDILKFFDEILGLSDIYAKGKIGIGLDYIARNRIENAVLVGDTEHDYEVAKALGVDCLLVAIGHQAKSKLLACGAPVLSGLLQVTEYIL